MKQSLFQDIFGCSKDGIWNWKMIAFPWPKKYGERLFWQVLVSIFFFGSRCAMANVGTGDVTQARNKKNVRLLCLWEKIEKTSLYNLRAITMPWHAYAVYAVYVHVVVICMFFWLASQFGEFLATDGPDVRAPLTPGTEVESTLVRICTA